MLFVTERMIVPTRRYLSYFDWPYFGKYGFMLDYQIISDSTDCHQRQFICHPLASWGEGCRSPWTGNVFAKDGSLIEEKEGCKSLNRRVEVALSSLMMEYSALYFEGQALCSVYCCDLDIRSEGARIIVLMRKSRLVRDTGLVCLPPLTLSPYLLPSHSHSHPTYCLPLTLSPYLLPSTHTLTLLIAFHSHSHPTYCLPLTLSPYLLPSTHTLTLLA